LRRNLQLGCKRSPQGSTLLRIGEIPPLRQTGFALSISRDEKCSSVEYISFLTDAICISATSGRFQGAFSELVHKKNVKSVRLYWHNAFYGHADIDEYAEVGCKGELVKKRTYYHNNCYKEGEIYLKVVLPKLL
jgi:hypothetical protein